MIGSTNGMSPGRSGFMLNLHETDFFEFLLRHPRDLSARRSTGGDPAVDFTGIVEQMDKLQQTDGSRFHGNGEEVCFVHSSHIEYLKRT
jgi:hypothetical protein